MSDTLQRFRKTILIGVFVFCVGAVLYINMLARSMRGEYAQIQHLETQEALRNQEREPLRQKVETDRAILTVIRADDPQRLTAFFSQGVLPDARVGNAPLAMSAVDLRAEKVLAYLLKKGLAINAQDLTGKTLLTEAAATAQPALVKSLLQHGANVNTVDRYGRTPLIRVLSIGQGGVIFPEPIRLPQTKTNIPSSSSASSRYWPRRGQDKDATVRLLVEHGADVNATDQRGWTPLMYAADNDAVSVRLLLAHGANVNAIDKEGESPLLHGIYYPEIVQLLLDKGADVNLVDKGLGTPLHFARKLRRTQSVAILLKADARDEAP